VSIQTVMAKAKSAIEYMYDKTATIKQYEAIVKPNGADGAEWRVKHENVPGRLSTIGAQTLKNAVLEDVNRVEYDVKYFMTSDIDVLVGDEFTISGVRYETSREPFVYVSHQEILLVRKGYA
jgi:hypothetical protein